MNSLCAIMAALAALLTLSACDSRTYRDGYTAGEKDGRVAGERAGYVRGYAAGTVKVISDDWLPSVGLGICGAIGLIAGGITLSLLWDSTGRLIIGSQRVGVWVWEHIDTWQFQRSYADQFDAMRQRECADAEARIRIQAAHTLRQAQRTLSEEDIRLHVEHLIRHSQLLRDMQDSFEVSMAACETALAHIQSDPNLTAGQKGKLLRHLAQTGPLAT